MTTPRKSTPKARQATSSPEWFTVDKGGLAALLERKSKAAVVAELFQNAWDEAGVTRVEATLTSTERRGIARLVVTDDAPDGFADLTHAYSLFARSAKVTDAEKRGRFNLGEKLVLAICDEATITSTTGGVAFDATGRKTTRTKRAAGSEFSALIRLTVAEVAEAAAFVRTLIPPAGIATTFNGEQLLERTPVRSFKAQLGTEIDRGEGQMARTIRRCTVDLHEPLPDEVATIYEMGIPVVEWDSPWHADIGQKVPLNFERDNVTPAWLRTLRVMVLNESHAMISAEESSHTWVSDALSDPRTGDEAIRTVVGHRFGDKAVAFDMNDREANANAIIAGYNVVHGGSLGKDQWANVKRAGALAPAGQVTPSLQIIAGPEGDPPLEREKWTPAMEAIAFYAQRLAASLLEVEIDVEIRNTDQPFLACYGRRTLGLNVRTLGHSWFDRPDQRKVDELLIHEFAHERVANHLSEDYHHELCRLAAAMRHATTVTL